MANTYIATPQIIPGSLAVQGDLSVTGQIHASQGQPEQAHVVSVGAVSGIGFNLVPGTTNRDDATKPGLILSFDGSRNILSGTRFPAFGAAKTLAIPLVEALQSLPLVITNTVAEAGAFNTNLAAGALSLIGQIRLLIYVSTTVQGAGASTLRVKLGGTTLVSTSIASVNERWIEVVIANRNVTNAQTTCLIVNANGVAPAIGAAITAIDTTVDLILSATIQPANLTDSHTVQLVAATLISAFQQL